MVVRMLAIPSASTPVTLRLRASATGFRRVSSIAVWFSSSFRTIGMSTGQPRSSFATSSYAKLCNKVIREPTNMTGDVDGKHEVKGEISPIQSISECKDLKKPSQEVSQAVDEVGFEKDLVCLKDGDRLMKLTIAELRGLMRKLGIPPTGRKQDLIQALKSFSRNKSADQSSENSIPKGSESFLSKITPDQPRNQGRRGQVKSLLVSSLKDSLTLARSGADNDGKLHVTGKKARNCKKQFNNNKQSIDVIPQSSSPQKETTVEGHLVKSASQVCEAQTIDSVDGCSEEGNMPLPSETDKGLAWKKRKVMKTVHNSKIKDGIAAGEAEQKINFEEPWTMLVHKKLQDGWVAYNPTTMRVTSPVGNANMIRLISWNVNGLRALLKRKEENPILQLAEREKFDVLCLQETKLQEKDVEQIKKGLLDGYENSFWTCSVSKLGYSGTAVISRIKPVSVKFGLGIQDHDGEGRLITIEFDRFYLVAGYVPNSGQKLERLTYRVQQWDPALSSYIKDLEQKKPVVLTGDLNCAHEEIDIYNPDGNHRSAGFTVEERKSFEDNYLNQGFVDSFRHKYPNTVGYTYWGYRQGARAYNRGWRLDYFLVSNAIVNNVYDSYILPDVNGSDHCPIGLILNL